MSFRIRTFTQLLTLASTLCVGTLAAQATQHPLTGWMVSGGIATLQAEGGGIWYPEIHLTGIGHSGWGADLGVGVYTGDGSGVLVDATVARAIASKSSAVGAIITLGPAAIFGEGGTAFGASIGGALLIRLAPKVGLRVDLSPRVYISDFSDGANAAITLGFSFTSLPGAWRSKGDE